MSAGSSAAVTDAGTPWALVHTNVVSRIYLRGGRKRTGAANG
jgi:hypothetical protein